jgi:hypothetical protein
VPGASRFMHTVRGSMTGHEKLSTQVKGGSPRPLEIGIECRSDLVAPPLSKKEKTFLVKDMVWFVKSTWRHAAGMRQPIAGALTAAGRTKA